MKSIRPALKQIMHKKVLIAVAIASVTMVLGLLWIGSPAAEDAGAVPEAGDPAPPPSISTGGMAFRVIGSVILVIAVLYAGMFAMKVLSRRAAGGNLKKDAISVLQRRYIEGAGDPQSQWLIVGGDAWVQLVEEPEALLGK